MLTEKKIKELPSKPKVYRVRDQRGLCLEIHSNGKKYWRYRFRFARKATMASYGQHPETSLAEARAAQAADVQTLKSGRNPVTERRMEKTRITISQGNTFASVAREWLDIRKNDWTPSNYLKEEGRLRNHVLPFIGRLPISEVGIAHIKEILKTLQDRGTLDTAHRIRQTASAVFQYAIANEYTEKNPALAMRNQLPTHHKRNFAHITDSNTLRELLRAIDGFSGLFHTKCALKLAPMLFIRPGELRQGEWAEIDFTSSCWRIPAPRLKLRKDKKLDSKTPPHIVPLSRQAVAILHELKLFTGDGKYLFPGARDARKPMSNATLNAALRRLGFPPDVIQPHGFRHTASTALNEMDRFPSHAIEAQLAHRKKGIEAEYNKAQYLLIRQEIMQVWSDYLDRLKSARQCTEPTAVVVVVPSNRLAGNSSNKEMYS